MGTCYLPLWPIDLFGPVFFSVCCEAVSNPCPSLSKATDGAKSFSHAANIKGKLIWIDDGGHQVFSVLICRTTTTTTTKHQSTGTYPMDLWGFIFILNNPEGNIMEKCALYFSLDEFMNLIGSPGITESDKYTCVSAWGVFNLKVNDYYPVLACVPSLSPSPRWHRLLMLFHIATRLLF